MNNLRIASSGTAVLCLIILALLPACTSQGPSRETPGAVEVVPELARLGLPGLSVEKRMHPRLQNLFDPEDRYLLIIHLGPLSEAQFNAIRQLYGHHSPVSYVPGKAYRLRDFLPLSVQAVINKTFTPVKYDLSFLQTYPYETRIENLRRSSPGSGEMRLIDGLLWKGVGTETNCWNATVETLNEVKAGSSRYRLFAPARWDIDHELKSAAFGRVVAAGERLRPWDVLLVSKQSPYSGREILQHTALVINEHLVFEKVDSSADYPYRLSLREDVLKKYRRALAETFRSEYRRYPDDRLLFAGSGLRDTPYPDLMAEIIRQVRPAIEPERLSYGCDSGREDKCAYSFQVVETLDLVAGEEGGKLLGPARILGRFQSLEAD
jgi:hypothetical protein